MYVFEFIKDLKKPAIIEFRNSKNVFICTAKSDSQGVNPYWVRTVLKWFWRLGKICILLEDEKPEPWFSDWTE